MSKSRKPAPKPVSKPTATTVASRLMDIPAWLLDAKRMSLALFVLAFALYANTLFHDFALDDGIVITDNMFTKQGVSGIGGILSKDTFFGFFKVEGKEALVSGGRYRPFTLVLFALVYQVAGSAPFVFHLLTVLLFAATCVMLYRTLLLLFGQPDAPANANMSLLALLTAAIFTVHPIHTEVVANIKGCDEIVTLLGSLGALYLIVRSVDQQRAGVAWLGGFVFFLASLSKENAAAFVLIIPLALYFFRGKNLGEAFKTSLPIMAAFALFFIIRGSILHWRFGGAPMELMNNPFLKIQGNEWVAYSFAEKFGTICYTLWKYIQLLIVPHPLTHDYYPRHIPQVSLGNPVALLGLVATIGMVVYALRGMGKRDTMAFGLLAYLLPLSIVSNVVFPIGTNMGERFAFMPSAGFSLVLALILLRINNVKTILGVAGVAMLLFSLKTLVRNPAWASNEKLFFTDVENSPNSAKIRNACGGVLFEKAGKEKDEAKRLDLCRQSLVHLNKAIEIYPNYSDAYVSRGGAHYYLKNYDQAVADYRAAVRLSPDNKTWPTYLALALRDGGKAAGEQRNDLAGALSRLQESWSINSQDAETARLLGVANGIQGKHPEAIQWFEKATQIAPNEATYWWDLGQAYSAAGQTAKGEEMRQKARQMNPEVGTKR